MSISASTSFLRPRALSNTTIRRLSRSPKLDQELLTAPNSVTLSKAKKLQQYSALSRAHVPSGISSKFPIQKNEQCTTSLQLPFASLLHPNSVVGANERRALSGSASTATPSVSGCSILRNTSWSQGDSLVLGLPSLSHNRASVLRPQQHVDVPSAHDVPALVFDESCNSSRTSSVDPITPPESPIARARRAPSTSQRPPVHLTTSQSSYNIDITLPTPGGQPLAPDMVTIAAKKGDKLDVVADAWHLEEDCHFEWHISFPLRSVNMASVRAEFNQDGHLAIRVPKHKYLAGRALPNAVIF